MAYTKINKLTMNFLDTDSNQAVCGGYVADALLPDAGGATGYVTATRALSDCAIIDYTITNGRVDEAFGPTVSVYGDVEEKLVMEFADARGLITSFELGGPVATDFLADGEVVDQADAAIAAWITATQALILSAAKLALVRFVRGYRDRLKFRK